MTSIGTVYLLHFAAPGPGRVRHYLGWTTDLGARLERHLAGRGSRLLRAVVAVGVSWRLARTWVGAGRQLERRLKRRHQHARLCPLCRPAALARHPAEEQVRRDRYAWVASVIRGDPCLIRVSPPPVAPIGVVCHVLPATRV
jgi:predicted GIY-YIG superfamily endonuclease